MTLIDPDLFRHPNFTAGISGVMLQNVSLGGAMIALPLFLQMTLEYNAHAGRPVADAAVAHHVRRRHGRREEGRRPPTGRHHPHRVPAHQPSGSRSSSRSCPGSPAAGTSPSRCIIAGAGLGLLVSQLNNYTLAPVDEERISEAAGVNSAAGSFGLSFGLAMAGGIMLAALSIELHEHDREQHRDPTRPAGSRSPTVLEDDAEIMSNTQLDALITDEPPEVEAAILEINDDARNLSLQVALAVPLLAALLGLANSFRMMRLPDLTPVGPARRHGLRLTLPGSSGQRCSHRSRPIDAQNITRRCAPRCNTRAPVLRDRAHHHGAAPAIVGLTASDSPSRDEVVGVMSRSRGRLAADRPSLLPIPLPNPPTMRSDRWRT